MAKKTADSGSIDISTKLKSSLKKSDDLPWQNNPEVKDPEVKENLSKNKRVLKFIQDLDAHEAKEKDPEVKAPKVEESSKAPDWVKNLRKKPPKKEVKLPVKPLKSKTIAKSYKLIKNQPISLTLNVGRDKKMIVWDESIQKSRAIRHCPNERSIFLDEQNKDISVVEPIVFLKGFFEATERQEYTQEFLEMHPKFNKLFELVDKGVDAKKDMDEANLIIDIKMAIRKRSEQPGGLEHLRAIVGALTNNPGKSSLMTLSELQKVAFETVDSNPKRFIDDNKEITIFDDGKIQRIAITQHAFLAGVIEVSSDGRKVIWCDNRAVVCSVPVGLNYQEVFSEFLGTEEGIQVAVELTKR